MSLLPQRFSSGRFPRCCDELAELAGVREEVVHLPTARVVLADYTVLREDFPQLGKISDTAIDDWLVEHAAWISRSQALQATVNSPIDVGVRTTQAFRPPRYGRAVIVQAPEGLLDLKGAGVREGQTPSHSNYSSGLEYVGVALADFLLKSAIDQIFKLAAPIYWSVPIYAVLDLGFDVTNGLLGTAPAGMHVRRAHRRPPGGMPLPETASSEQFDQFEIEMTLRSYGFTSATVANSFEIAETHGRVEAYDRGVQVTPLTAEDTAFFRALSRGNANCRVERLNVQLTRREPGAGPGELVDFGHIHVRPRFEDPLCGPVSDRPFCLGPVMWPEESVYIQPDPLLHVPAAVWHRPNLNQLCFELAEQFRTGRSTSAELVERLEAPLCELLEQWAEARWQAMDTLHAADPPRRGNERQA